MVAKIKKKTFVRFPEQQLANFIVTAPILKLAKFCDPPDIYVYMGICLINPSERFYLTEKANFPTVYILEMTSR